MLSSELLKMFEPFTCQPFLNDLFRRPFRKRQIRVNPLIEASLIKTQTKIKSLYFSVYPMSKE
jgi:hypothetical protein